MADVYGWAFPVSVDPSTGRIREVNDEDLVRQSIRMILMTDYGERHYYPDFGCGLRQYAFGFTDYTALRRLEAEVKSCIERWEYFFTRPQRLTYWNRVDEAQSGWAVCV